MVKNYHAYGTNNLIINLSSSAKTQLTDLFGFSWKPFNSSILKPKMVAAWNPLTLNSSEIFTKFHIWAFLRTLKAIVKLTTLISEIQNG